jgi:hypothetical protein
MRYRSLARFLFSRGIFIWYLGKGRSGNRVSVLLFVRVLGRKDRREVGAMDAFAY